jgi:CMP/dCMP kinase
MSGQSSAILITIDGPAGAGKTTVSKMLADRLGYRYIDTGALYRGVAFEAKQAGTDINKEDEIQRLCNGLRLNLVHDDQRRLRLLSGDRDITDLIRTPEIAMLASAVSAKSIVRQFLFELQRSLGAANGAVFEGRDMGTVVFPEAEVKFFLSASIKTRARRRFLEMPPDSGQTLEDVERDMAKRDANDASRQISPLKPASDAIQLDSTDLSIEQVLERMMEYIRNVP